MDIFLALVRTLVFVVATVVATVYVGRRLARGLALAWTGTTLLALHWLIQFGWTTYTAGAAGQASDADGWAAWSGHLLPFFAALSYLAALAMAVGRPAVPARARPPQADAPTPPAPAAPAPTPARPATPASGSTPPEPPVKPRTRPAGLIAPHAVPVVMTPSSSHHSPPDPDPVVDLGPEPDEDAWGSAGRPVAAPEAPADDPTTVVKPTGESPEEPGRPER
ncbi:MAG: hypothetical protein R2719_15885 [Micropruina sp.]